MVLMRQMRHFTVISKFTISNLGNANPTWIIPKNVFHDNITFQGCVYDKNVNHYLKIVSKLLMNDLI